MRQVPADYTMRLAPLGVSKQQTLEFLLNPDEYLRRIGLSADDGQRLLLLKDLAGILTALHDHGITVGDLSPKNILFRLDVWPRCFLIDCDSMRFKGRDALPQMETPGWEVPETGKATPESDAYKLGLVALRLFNRSQEGTDAGPLRSVSTELADLATRSQSGEPGRRPTPRAWQAALQRAIEGGKSDSSWIDVDPV
jgi:DNA-binding helix-hairpin-helix protein with protein kinase domain